MGRAAFAFHNLLHQNIAIQTRRDLHGVEWQGWKVVEKEIHPIYCWWQATGEYGWSPLCVVSAESRGRGWEGGLARSHGTAGSYG